MIKVKTADGSARNTGYSGTEMPEFGIAWAGGSGVAGRLYGARSMAWSRAARSGRRRRIRSEARNSADRTDAHRISERRVSLRIRRVRPADVARVTALDKRVTAMAKARYWQDVFERYGRRRTKERFFLVAEPLEGRPAGKILGFIIGEVRAWEFGSGPCGWIFALSVEPAARLHGIGEALFKAISAEFKEAGVTKVRTMVARDSPLPMLFFRGEGMVAGPYIQLEKELD